MKNLDILVGEVKKYRDFSEAWYETALFHMKNEQYYHDICNKIGELIGKEAYTADDGGVGDSVLCCKLPELVKKLIDESRYN